MWASTSPGAGVSGTSSVAAGAGVSGTCSVAAVDVPCGGSLSGGGTPGSASVVAIGAVDVPVDVVDVALGGGL